MNPNLTEWAPPLPLAPADLGESAVETIVPGVDEEWALISFLRQPLPLDSRLDYVVMSFADTVPAAPGSLTAELRYEWTVTAGVTGWILAHEEGEEGVFHWTCKAPGTYEVKVVVTSGGAEVVTLTLTQVAAAPSLEWRTAEAAVLSGSRTPKKLASQLFAMREICVELHDDIVAAAAATGHDGVPALLVAAVLFMEAWGRPKDGSPGADSIRTRLAGKAYNPRVDALWEKAQRAFASGPGLKLHLHDIREVELELVRDFINHDRIGLGSIGPKSIGVGQLAMTTAAMVLGETPWTELNETTRKKNLQDIEEAYNALTLETRTDVFNALRFPRRNAWVVAQLLARLKNRPHRFPGLTADQVRADPNAVDIIATEYNRGGYDTPLASMKGNSNGKRAKQYVLGPSFIGLEKFFP